MRPVRIMLFTLLGATIAGVVALVITSNVERGPAVTFHLVPSSHATGAQLNSDAAAVVRRLEGLGYGNTQATASGQSIVVTMYGSAPQLRSALESVLVPGKVSVRPVECAAPLQSSNQGLESQLHARASKCTAKYLLTAKTLKVDTTTGRPTATIGVDPTFASVPTTAAKNESSSETVVLPAANHSGFAGNRLVLGPAPLANEDVISAGAATVSNDWVVNIVFTTVGAKAYDALAAKQFHAYLAFDIDGTVVSAPLVQPTSTTYSSPGTSLQIRASFTKAQAVTLADNLTSPLVVPLKLVS